MRKRSPELLWSSTIVKVLEHVKLLAKFFKWSSIISSPCHLTNTTRNTKGWHHSTQKRWHRRRWHRSRPSSYSTWPPKGQISLTRSSELMSEMSDDPCHEINVTQCRIIHVLMIFFSFSFCKNIFDSEVKETLKKERFSSVNLGFTCCSTSFNSSEETVPSPSLSLQSKNHPLQTEGNVRLDYVDPSTRGFCSHFQVVTASPNKLST